MASRKIYQQAYGIFNAKQVALATGKPPVGRSVRALRPLQEQAIENKYMAAISAHNTWREV
ncbi:MAG: hypothetical protein FWG10_03650 [Eubacteriaceae bacterium]|nr:hypothetical protein [Eubacteriaceae bacterium]